MYALDDVAADKEQFQLAVLNGQAYKPLYVKLKLVWGCNLRCRMCNHWREDRGRSLPLAQWQAIVAELAELGCRKIHISGGEPTQYPHLVELVATMNELGLRVNMTTNGTLLSSDRARALVKAGLRGTNISIDSPDRRTHDRIRGQKGAWKRAVKGARRLRRRLKKGTLRINTVIGRRNYDSLVDMPDLAAEIGADALNLIPLDTHTGDLKQLNKRQIADYNRRIAPVIAQKALASGLMKSEVEAYPFGRSSGEVNLSRDGQYALGYYERRPCYAPWTHALINHLGQVTVCCMMRDRPVMGDLRWQSFNEIWQGAIYAGLRKRQQGPLFEACRSCDDFLVENRRLDEIANNSQ